MNRRLVLATRNQGKVAELRLALAPLGLEVVSAVEVGLGDAPDETGTGYEENALIKAAHAAHASGLPALADDSGLEVEALGGAPGVYSARFGGRMGDGERNAYLLNRLRNVPEDRRGARFVCVLVLALPDGRVKSFCGTCEGRILFGPRGEGGHGYDPLFWSPELGMTFAEAEPAQKGSVSHRGRALAGFLDWADRNPDWFTPGGSETG